MIVIENVDRETAIERILTFLSLSEEDEKLHVLPVHWESFGAEEIKGLTKFQRLPLQYFNAAQPFAYLSLMFLTKSYDRYVWEPEDPELQSLPLPGWDSTIIGIDNQGPQDAAAVGRQYMYTLERVRKVPLKEIRGLFQMQTGDVVELAHAMVYAGGTYTTQRCYCERRRGRWVQVAVPYAINPIPCSDDTNKSIWMHKSLAFTTEYDWQTQISYVGSGLPSIALTCDPMGAKDIFKMRDVAAGKTRRAALKHWVSEHWRKTPPDRPEVHIWPFLRGAEEFTWNGLHCKIQPSAYDLRKAAEFQRAKRAK
jgi:hypothetical protein